MRAEDGAPVELPEVMVRPGCYRFVPDGTGLVYLPRIQSLEFWLFEFVTKTARQITRLENRGAVRTFDVTRDRSTSCSTRLRQNSNIVSIDLGQTVLNQRGQA